MNDNFKIEIISKYVISNSWTWLKHIKHKIMRQDFYKVGQNMGWNKKKVAESVV